MSEAERPRSQGLPSDYEVPSPGHRAGHGRKPGGRRGVLAGNNHELEALAGVVDDVSGRLTVLDARLEQALEDASPDDPNRARLLQIQQACRDAIALTRQLIS